MTFHRVPAWRVIGQFHEAEKQLGDMLVKEIAAARARGCTVEQVQDEIIIIEPETTK